MAESEESTPGDNRRKRREGDGRVLLWIAAGFLLAALIAAAMANAQEREESHHAAMAFSVVGLSAAIVLGAWGLALLSHYEATKAANKTKTFLRRLRWRSTLRKNKFHLAISFVAVLISHLTIVFAVDYSNRDGTKAFQERRILPYIADPILLGVQFDVLLRDRNVGHIVCIPANSWNPTNLNWYERRFRTNVTNESESTLERLGWSRQLLHKQAESGKAEIQSLNAVPPLDRESVFGFAHSHPDWKIEGQSNSVRIDVPDGFVIYHTFYDGANLWLVDDPDKTLLRRDILGSTRLIMYRDKKRGTEVFFQPVLRDDDKNGPDSFFSSLSVCLGALFIAWLALLAPLFYLRLLPANAAEMHS